MKLALVTINYKRKDLLENCLRSVFAATYDDELDVIVVDNGSEDGSAAMVDEKFPRATYISVGYNAGFCEGSNIGIARALEGDADAVVLLNNDAEVTPSFFMELVGSVDREKRIAMVAPKVLLLSDKETIDTAGLLITPDGAGKTRGYGEVEVTDGKSVFCPSGSAALYTRELLEDIVMDGQYFDEDFVFYVEEVDLGWRARLRGWQCAYNPQAIAYHQRHSTTGSFPELRIFHANRNVYYNIIKNYPGFSMGRALVHALVKYPILGVAALFGKGLVVDLYKSVGIGRLIILNLKGLLHVVTMLPRLLRKRQRIQKSRTVTDAHVDEFFSDSGVTFSDSLFKP